jgi:aspartyl-tRNA(Asn)/glutamyl-tRNA(Gln) amidotransferase subunit C
MKQSSHTLYNMDVKKIAQLAHLEISDEDVGLYSPQMDAIVAYIEQLKELKTESVLPAAGGLTPEGETTSADRDDVPIESLGQSAALGQAPESAAGYFRVPKVL